MRNFIAAQIFVSVLCILQANAKPVEGITLDARVKTKEITRIVVAEVIRAQPPSAKNLQDAMLSNIQFHIIKSLFGPNKLPSTVDTKVDLVQRNLAYAPPLERAILRPHMRWILYLPKDFEKSKLVTAWSLATADNLKFADQTIRGQVHKADPPDVTLDAIEEVNRMRLQSDNNRKKN